MSSARRAPADQVAPTPDRRAATTSTCPGTRLRPRRCARPIAGSARHRSTRGPWIDRGDRAVRSLRPTPVAAQAPTRWPTVYAARCRGRV